MLDELLGRAALKERIAELEDEKAALESQLEAEQDRRADAASARQDAEERVNRLEDRIAQLEGDLERSGADETGPDFRGRETLRGARLGSVLDRLESLAADREGILTAMVAEGAVPDPVADAVGDRAGLVERAAPCLVVTDDAGLVSVALRPPVAPEPFVTWSDAVELDRSWFEPTGRHAVALVRADLFAIGEYDGRELLDSHGFESQVKGNHSKGGFSQARFERIRDDQIEAHLARCREAIEDRDAERLYVVGGAGAVAEFAEDAVATAAVDATGDPEDALSAAVREFWSVPLYRL